MPSPALGILTGKDLEEFKPEVSPRYTSAKDAWKPTTPRLYRFSRWRPFTSSHDLRPTAYLDGLRGFAAFLVYWHHHQLWVHDMTGQNGILENAFGYNDYWEISTLPFLRIFFTGGHFAVAVFFVISGYVLSSKPLRLIENGDHGALSDGLASGLFRRWVRLFLPLVLVLLVYVSSWHIFGIYVHGVDQEGRLRDELWKLYVEFKNFSFVFKEGGEPWLSYHFHLWTIPLEFKGSIVVYTTLMALSRARRGARLFIEAALIVYFLYVADGWYCAAFLAGMFLCDLDLLSDADALPFFIPSRIQNGKNVIFYHFLIISLFLGGIPCENADVDQLAHNRGWWYLSWFKPQAVYDYKWFYLFWAAVFLVSSTPRIAWLKGFFETGFCQYLGRISFSLYLVHGPVLWTLGDRLYLATGGWHSEQQLKVLASWYNAFPLSTSKPLGLESAFLVPHIILLPVTLGLAEMVTRLADGPSVRFAAWLYRRVTS